MSTIQMVMWMNRVERKKLKKKKGFTTTILVVCLIVFLFIGIIITDNALRQMMALGEEGRVFGYEREENYHLINLLGRTFYVDQRVIDDKTREASLWLRESYDHIKRSLAR